VQNVNPLVTVLLAKSLYIDDRFTDFIITHGIFLHHSEGDRRAYVVDLDWEFLLPDWILVPFVMCLRSKLFVLGSNDTKGVHFAPRVSVALKLCLNDFDEQDSALIHSLNYIQST